ncbi:DNA polymerase III epsilon subunit [Nonlabens ulvanivorans]|uniref:DNA polymerase III epsilon subunit n=2 Tax=Nonlabens ulvanivorans TaxID=906888 RepID=A0A090QJS6_NONUL|nr:exonuclease domain-containing protein [Nonlabens ulvanivorans]GAL02044.1 DNA polymerase III epsilon subunit [Nonlabens ulvanivorans]
MYAIVDVETTGGKFNEEGITEIAIYKFDGHEIVDQFASLVNPEKEIQPFVVKLTGINNKMLVRAPKFYEVAKRVIEIMDGAVLVAHNANFDYRMLRIEFERLGYEFQTQTLCTVELAQKLMPEEDSYSLGKLTRSLGIPITDRHRATGDALATVKLFKMLMAKDTDKTIISTSLKSETRKKVEPNLKKLIEKSESTTGVYYFYNQDNELIYLGKSKNIKKRITQLFTSSQPKQKKIKKLVTDISFEKTGNELIALLKENVEIKKNKPKFNKPLKRKNFSHGLYSFIDDHGYINLTVKNIGKDMGYITSFSSLKSGKNFLEKMVSEHQLCKKLVGLEKTDSSCENYPIEKCLGACIRKEDKESYNNRVQEIIDQNSFVNKNIIIVDNGREATERSAIMIEDGIVLGYGFVDLQFQVTHPQVLKKVITPLSNNLDSRHIVQSYLRHKKVKRIIEY